MNPMPPITRALLWANGIVFLLQQAMGMEAFSGLMLWPLGDYALGGGVSGSLFYPWQLLTYGFLHANVMHIFFNMLALWMFGTSLEYTWGQRRFLTYYLTCVAGAGLIRSEEHTSELQSLMRISSAVFCLKKKTNTTTQT